MGRIVELTYTVPDRVYPSVVLYLPEENYDRLKNQYHVLNETVVWKWICQHLVMSEERFHEETGLTLDDAALRVYWNLLGASVNKMPTVRYLDNLEEEAEESSVEAKVKNISAEWLSDEEFDELADEEVDFMDGLNRILNREMYSRD